MAVLTPPGWEGILEPGEHIVWQGRPDPRFGLTGAHIALGMFGLFFAAFAALWMMLALSAGGVFWIFGLLHFAIGLCIALAAPLGGPFLRRRTWYSLTNRRAFIATNLPLTGRSLRDYPITPDTPIAFVEGTLSSIHFASHLGKLGTRHIRQRRQRTYSTPIGFDHLPDGRAVLAQIRQIQSLQTPSPDQRPAR